MGWGLEEQAADSMGRQRAMPVMGSMGVQQHLTPEVVPTEGSAQGRSARLRAFAQSCWAVVVCAVHTADVWGPCGRQGI